MKRRWISRKAFSKDGYLIDQRWIKQVPYGLKQSNENGCGWIAAYNFLHAKRDEKNCDLIRQQLEEYLLFGGLLGTHILQLYFYLRKQGYCLHWRFGKKAINRLPQSISAGILFYFNGKSLHFVTLVAEIDRNDADEEIGKNLEQQKEKQYRFFNGNMGNEEDYSTIEEFIERESKSAVMVLLCDC